MQITGFAFRPGTITVRAGSRVTFVNHDGTAHTATAAATPAAFDTGTVPAGASRTVTLTRAGTYTYFCQFHAFMRATVVVTG